MSQFTAPRRKLVLLEQSTLGTVSLRLFDKTYLLKLYDFEKREIKVKNRKVKQCYVTRHTKDHTTLLERFSH